MGHKLGIVGSRSYPYMKEVEYFVKTLPKDTIVVSGSDWGVDRTVEDTAKRYDLEILILKADYATYKKKSAYIRNHQLVATCDALVVFWDGESKDAKNIIDIAYNLKKPIKIFTSRPLKIEGEFI